ncbi:hypothetical protein [Undibacterium sp. TC9W]|uniref:hypothetical protein n=1 Tax=Undibacterium sp. TC9W TaxID=3413053 RepID=UPI003BF388D2
MKIFPAGLIAATLALSHLTNATAASGTPPSPKSKQVQGIKFSIDMLEKNKLPLNMKGANLMETINALEKISLMKKGEFETTVDFENRKSAAYSTKLPDGLNLQDYFAFDFPVKAVRDISSGLVYNYDADSSEVQFFALPLTPQLNGIGSPDHVTQSDSVLKNLDVFDFYSKIESNEKFRGRNAYGVTINIQRISSIAFGIVSKNISYLYFKRHTSYYDLPTSVARMNMAGTTAAKELPSLRALMVTKVVSPYLIYHFSSLKPAIDRPRESFLEKKYLNTAVSGVIFYSGRTGEIYARVPENFGLQPNE